MEYLRRIQPMPTANYYCNDKSNNTGGTGTGGCGTGGTSTNTGTGTGTGIGGTGGNSTINQYFYSIRESENDYL
jgi:hypothetical protein